MMPGRVLMGDYCVHYKHRMSARLVFAFAVDLSFVADAVASRVDDVCVALLAS